MSCVGTCGTFSSVEHPKLNAGSVGGTSHCSAEGINFTDKASFLDDYIVPCYDALHTQGKDYIVHELKELMQKRGVIK